MGSLENKLIDDEVDVIAPESDLKTIKNCLLIMNSEGAGARKYFYWQLRLWVLKNSWIYGCSCKEPTNFPRFHHEFIVDTHPNEYGNSPFLLYFRRNRRPALKFSKVFFNGP